MQSLAKDQMLLAYLDLQLVQLRQLNLDHEFRQQVDGLQNEFVIIVDTNFKSTNFISFDEDYSRTQSNELDTAYLSLLAPEEWEKLSFKQIDSSYRNHLIKYNLCLCKSFIGSIHLKLYVSLSEVVF